MQTFEAIREEIKAVPIDAIAAALHIELSGKPPAGRCPTGHVGKSGRSFRLTPWNGFHCFGCGAGGDNIDLVQLVEKQLDHIGAIEWIIERFRPELAEPFRRARHKWNGQEARKDGKYYTAAALYEKVFELGRGLLYEDAGKEAREYLLNVRGYDLETLKKTDWIYYPPAAQIKAHLLKELAGEGAGESIDALALIPHCGDILRAALPWRDRGGHITGFILRATEKEGASWNRDGKIELVRWGSTAGTKKDDLFNLCYCRGKRTVVIVEGVPDAAYLSRLDLGAGVGIAAVGQGLLSEKHIDGLKAFKIKEVILALDNDEARTPGDDKGIKNTAAAIERLRGSGIDALAIHPPRYGATIKDPDELVASSGGADALRSLISSAESWYNWKYRRLAETHPTTTDREATAFFSGVRDLIAHVDPLEAAELKKTIRADVGAGVDLDEIFTEIQTRRDRQRQETAVKSAIAKHSRGEIDALELSDELNRIVSASVSPAAILPVSARLRNKQQRDATRSPGQLLGYRLNRFAPIAEAIDGVQSGFYVFAGITHVGKTAFLTNIFSDLLESNGDLFGVYFSLDDNENVIINRLLAIECGGVLKINDLQRAVKDPTAAGKLAAAYDKLANLADAGRFNIMDFAQIQTIEGVESVIRSYIRDGKKLVAVIDGLQNIETGKEYGGLREKNVDLAANMKRLVDVYQIPILTSVEIRKRKSDKPENAAVMPTIDDIMESGKYGYNANHIWIGHPDKDFQNFIDREKPSYRLTVKSAKSKISESSGSFIEIIVDRSYNKLTIEGGRQSENHSAVDLARLMP